MNLTLDQREGEDRSTGVRTKKGKILKALLKHKGSPEDFLAQKAASCESNHDLRPLKTLANYPPAKRRPNVKGLRIPTKGARNFICPVTGCEKRFRRMEHVGRHELLHSGERPFHCAACNVSFSRSDVLSQHDKTQKHLALILLRELKNKEISWQDVATVLDVEPAGIFGGEN